MENIVHTKIPQKKRNYSKHKVTKVYPRAYLMFFILLVQVIIEINSNGSFFDEGITIFFLGILAFKIRKFTAEDLLSIIIFVLTIGIGLLSNAIHSINPSYFSVLVDTLTQCKFFAAFYAINYFLNEKEKQALSEMIMPIARVYFIVAFTFAILSLIFDTGMSGAVRYGLKTYRFIFRFAFQYTSISFLLFGSIVTSKKMSEKKKVSYYIIACISILAVLKSPGLMFPMFFTFFAIYFNKYDKLNFKIIIVIIIVGIWISNYQIQTYLLNKAAPRRLFFDYSIVTAKNYFPLGSGFGTYGSAEASKNYSKLYYEYGFHKLYGMNPTDGSFLSDTYWPCVIGQFGFIGGTLWITLYIRVFRSIIHSKTSGTRRAYQYAVFLTFMIHAIGAAIITNSAGLIGLMSLAIYTNPNFEESKKRKRRRINIALR